MIESARDRAAPERHTMKLTDSKSHFPVRPAPKRKRKRSKPVPVKPPAPPQPEKKEQSNG